MELSMQLTADFDSRQDSRLRLLRQIFGAVWLVNAAFQAMAWLLVPAAKTNFLHALAKPAGKVPAALRPLLMAGLHVTEAVGPQFVAACLVVIAVALGLCLLTGRKVALAARVGIGYSLFCWVFLLGFGYPYSGGQTDPGVMIVYAIGFLFVLATAPDLNGGATGIARNRARLWEAARVSFGLLWLFDAALKWLPAFMFHFTSQITGVMAGQPAWIDAWLRFVADIIHLIGPVLVAVLVGLAETTIAVGLLSANRLNGKWQRLLILFGIAYSLFVWTTPETFGGPYSTAGTGVRGNVLGNVLMYLVPFMFLWVGTLRARSPQQ
jgi:hypothetical protein